MNALFALALLASSGALVADGKKAPAYVLPGGKGVVRLLLGAAHGANAAVSHLTLAPGAEVPPHTHDASSELLYIESGSVDMLLGGKPFTARAGDAVLIPAGVLHSARVTSPFESVRAVQIYVGPGPEQRFTQGERLSP